MSDDNEKTTLAKNIPVGIEHDVIVRHGKDAAGNPTSTPEQINKAVAAMGDEIKPDVPMGLAVLAHDADLHALARRTAGDLLKNEAKFHCMACGWSKSLLFDKEEMEAMDNDITTYTGPCPSCNCMTLVLADKFWGADFPSMNSLADKGKRADARIHAEEMVGALKEAVGDVLLPKAPAADAAPDAGEAEPADADDLPEEADPSKLTPR